MKQPIILVGGGGHCISCIDVIESSSEFTICGIIDNTDKLHQKVLGYEIIATDDDIGRLVAENYSFLITVGFISKVSTRIKLFNILSSLHAKMPIVLSSKAYVSQHAKIGMASIVMHNAILNAGALVGNNVIINTNTVIEHNVKIGDHSHISTGVLVNGDCILGDRIFLGSNCVVSGGISITHDVIVGAGSVVIRSIQESGVYVGNPVRKIR
jgi:sugar O-acyltransferase (sialic acid O-acetyltransferase NeuD family)